MSSIPFRTAFWALGLSFMMAVMLLIPNPQRIRMALHAKRNPAELPHSASIAVTTSKPSEKPAETAPKKPAEQTDTRITETRRSNPLRNRPRPVPVAESQPERSTESQPVRVASADPTASIGYQPAPSEAIPLTTASSVPPVEIAPTREIAAKEIAAVAAPHLSDSDAIPAAQPLSIPVPEPAQPTLPLASAPKVEENKLLAAPSFPSEAAKPVVSPAREPEASAKVTPVKMSVVELSEDETMSITAGSHTNLYNFRFTKSPIANVFKVLGRYQGYTVIVADDIQGEYSGQLLDAEPAQAFAALVKSQGCKVSRRGNILLLSNRDSVIYR